MATTSMAATISPVDRQRPGRRPLGAFRKTRSPREFRRGIFLLPSIFTVANMFCGYACVVHAMLGQLETAAPFIGIAIVLDMLDGRIARMTGTATRFGLELDSLADVISFGFAPAVLAFARYFVRPHCPDCGVEQFVPERSEFAGEGRVQHVWLCESCNHLFSTAVEFGAVAA